MKRMREEELEQAYGQGSFEISSAITAGVDVSILVENLALTPTQRLEQLQQVVRFLEELQKASGHGAPA
jgi:hypothetical protein